MSAMCSVPTCSAEATHEVGMGGNLCTRHALAWDANEDARLGRLHDLQHGDPDSDMDIVWAEHFSEWCGAQT